MTKFGDEQHDNLLVSGIYYPSEKLVLATEEKETLDSIKWYSISKDGSGNISDCWDPSGDDYPKAMFNIVLDLAKKLRQKETKWQKIINKLFHHSSYRFSHYDCLLLLDEISKIKNGG